MLIRSNFFVGFCAALAWLVIVCFPVRAADDAAGEGPAASRIPPEKRLALLIANAGYSDTVGKLRTPPADVELMKRTLEKVGFQVVVQSDLNRIGLRRAVADYAKRLNEAGDNTVGFFYYVGHGAAASSVGPNFLIPVDADLATDALDIAGEKLEDVVERLGDVSNSVMQFVVFDACRSVMKRPGRGTAGGFAQVGQRRGMIMVFSAEAQTAALDEYPKGSANGPFATVLAQVVAKSSDPDTTVIRNVQNGVYALTQGNQSPYMVASPAKTFFFNRPPVDSTPAGPAIDPAPIRVGNALDQIQSAINSGSLAQADRDSLAAILDQIRARGLKKRPFTYYAPGDLIPGSGNGAKDMTNYAPDIVFPVENADAFVNSQIFGFGGAGWSGKGSLGGSEMDPRNYTYPWRDNFCEPRAWKVPACPSGAGHQGVDIRAGAIDPVTDHVRPGKAYDGIGRVRLVAVEDGVLTLVSKNVTIRLESSDGKRVWEYLNLCPPDVTVKEGQTVKAGDFLGFVGNCMMGTPNTTLHLHLQLSIKDGTSKRIVSPYMTLVRAYERRVGVGTLISD